MEKTRKGYMPLKNALTARLADGFPQKYVIHESQRNKTQKIQLHLKRGSKAKTPPPATHACIYPSIYTPFFLSRSLSRPAEIAIAQTIFYVFSSFPEISLFISFLFSLPLIFRYYSASSTIVSRRLFLAARGGGQPSSTS